VTTSSFDPALQQSGTPTREAGNRRQCDGEQPEPASTQQSAGRNGSRITQKEMTMTKIFHTALLAVALLAVASPSMARSSWTDMSQPYGGYSPNSQEGNRAFWDYQARHGGN
jgi:hypothetical protein